MSGSEQLAPYVPRLVVDWLSETPDASHRRVDGSVVFADISGFTNLTERLAQRGKVGAEEMSDLLNLTFEQLLSSAYDYGAGLVKWGGDAVLLLFDGDRHAEMAARAAAEMQRTIRRVGRLRTSAGAVNLGMSVGIHSGAFDFLLVGHRHRELVVTGPGATEVALLEKAAASGQVVISKATAALLSESGAPMPGPEVGPGLLLGAAPDVPLSPNRAPKPLGDIDLGSVMDEALREHLLAGPVDPEHRHVAIGFIEFSGADELLRSEGAEALAAAVEHLVDATEEASAANRITLLSSDISPDGGKVILVSGAPHTAGDNEARVLGAIRRVIDAGGRLALRAGVNSGRVFAGDFGPFYRRTYSIAGDCVNLAARLMAKAAPGEVIATRSVLDRTGTAFELTELPPFAVKGKSEPVVALKVGPLRSSRQRAETHSLPLIGREAELATLVDAFQEATRGAGQVVELVGEPGMGKSRLVEELGARVESDMLWARGDLYARSTPYQPLQRLLRKQLGLPDAAEEAAVATALTKAIRSRAPGLRPWLPLIGIVAGVATESTPQVDAINPEFRKSKLEQVTSALLGAILRRPTVFIFDDVQLMDDASVDVLRQLAADIATRPWLLLVTGRSLAASPISDVENVSRIELQPLDEAATESLIAAVSEASPISHRRQAALARRAGGNPLFLRELVAGAGETGDLEALPASVEGVIAARIDALPPDQRRLLRGASVLGMVIDEDILDAVLFPEAGGRAAADFGSLTEFVSRDATGRLTFSHHLVREAAYEGLPYKRRVVLHGRAGDLIEQAAGAQRDDQAELLSLHFMAAERYHAAWRYSRLAGDRARASYADADAIEFYERAISAADHLAGIQPGEVAAVQEDLSDAGFMLGEYDRAYTAIRQARRLVRGDPKRLARLSLKAGRICEGDGRYTLGLRWLTRGRRVLDEAGGNGSTTSLTARLAHRYARILHLQGRSTEALSWARTAMEQAEAAGDQETLAHAFEILHWIGAVIGQQDGENYAQRALDIHVARGDLIGQGRAANMLGVGAFYRGRWEEAISYYQQARAAWDRGGDHLSAATAHANVAEILSDQGRLSEAADILRGTLRVWKTARQVNDIILGSYLLGRISARSGRHVEALAMFDEARQLALAARMQGEVVLIDGLTAECLVMAGRPDEALALTAQALASAAGLGAADASVPLLLRVQGLALAELGRLDAANAALCGSLDTSRRRDAQHEVAFTLDSMLRLDFTPDCVTQESAARERDQIFQQLGILGPEEALIEATG